MAAPTLRGGAALVAALLLALLVALPTSPAGAHTMPTSAVLLDIGQHDVTGELELPVDRLAVALGRSITPAQAAGPQRAPIEAYVAKHIGATGASGAAWTVRLGRVTVRDVDAIPDLVVPVRLTPPAGQAVTDFTLRYDAIIEQLVTHKALVTVRTDFDHGVVGGTPEPIGTFDFSTHQLAVHAAGGSWLRGMATTAGLGVKHVGEGADHLLFLLMLLLPAPLVATGGRWRRSPTIKRSALRVVHVVSAFAVGHTTTLLLAGLGVVHLPSRPIETLIAVSIAVSAVHAVRPLVRRGEVLIAAGFGLVHGLAFATFLGDLQLHGGTLVSSLLGFNLGIEATQLLVVALVMPSLVVLARTAWYSVLRLGVAAVGFTFATSWMLERSALSSSDPFLPVTDWLVANPLLVAAALAVLALLARAFPGGRQPEPQLANAAAG